MEKFGRSKSIEDQKKQMLAVEQKVGAKIIPNDGELFLPEKLVKKYPERYRNFIEIVRGLKNPKYASEKIQDAVKRLKILDNLEKYIFTAEDGGDKTLLPRQLETVTCIAGFLEKGYTEGNVTLPTGIGKTVIFSKFIEAVIKNNTARVLVVGPTKIILHQNKWKMDAFGEIEAGAYYGNEKDLSKQVTVTTYASLRNGIERKDIDPKKFDVIILDEAHRALGTETVEAIEAFSEQVIKIGFTATPEFHEEKSVADILPVTIDEMSLREGIEGELLAGLKVFMVSTKKDASLLKRSGKDYEDVALEKIVNTVDRNRLVVRVYKENKHFNGKLAVVFCASKQHAKDMTKIFQEEGISAAFIDGDMGDIERENLLLKFKHGEIKVLCNTRVLVEGFDETEAEVCINAVPTMSKVVAEQRGGRVLRRSRVKNNKIGNIIEIVDEFGKSANTPVLFSEVAGAAEIFPKDKKEIEKTNEETKGKNIPKEQRDVEVTADVVSDPDLIMRLTNQNARQRFDKEFKYAPIGWTHSRRLAHELNVKEKEVRLFAEQQKENRPDLFKRYLTSTDILTTHYHPELSHEIRRHYMPELYSMMTPKEYAEKFVLEEKRASELLASAEDVATKDALHFDGESYYSKEEYSGIISAEERLARNAQGKEAEEAENRYWQDDDRTEAEKESEYWAVFSRGEIEDLYSEEVSFGYGEIEHPKKIPFLEEMHTHRQGEESLSEKQIEIIYAVLSSIPKRLRMVITERFFEGKTLKEVGQEMRVSVQRVRGMESEGLRILRHPTRARILQSLFNTGEDIDSEIIGGVPQQEIFTAESMPMKDLIVKFNNFSSLLEKKKSGQYVMLPSEEENVNLFEKAFSSLHTSDQIAIKKFAKAGLPDNIPLSAEEEEQAKFVFNLLTFRLILNQSNVGLGGKVSSDGKMVDIYGITGITGESIGSTLQLNFIEKKIRKLENNRYWLSDSSYRKELSLLKKHRRVLVNRIKELVTYRKKYKEHFT